MAVDYETVVDKLITVKEHDDVYDVPLELRSTKDVNDVYRPLLRSAVTAFYDDVPVDTAPVNTARLTVKVVYDYSNWGSLRWKLLAVLVNLSAGADVGHMYVVKATSVPYTMTMDDNPPPLLDEDGHDLVAACGMTAAYADMYALAKQRLQLVYGTMELKK